ncbi:MAG: hypothetical protein J6W45_04960, partial [Bacteroidales bacterium]|nr:hypothetical protein [Bacteroidales bacterium]
RFTKFFIDVYSQLGDTAMSKEYLNDITKYYEQELKYFAQFKGEKAKGVRRSLEESVQILVALEELARTRVNDPQKADEIAAMYKPYLSMFGYGY